MKICINGAINLLQAVLISYAELIDGKLIYKDNRMIQFNFAPFVNKIEGTHKKKTKEEKEKYKRQVEFSKMLYERKKIKATENWELQRRNWLKQQKIWVLKDGFWFKSYAETFGYHEDKLKQGFINIIEKKLST